MTNEELDDMINAHWDYIRSVLSTHDEKQKVIAKIGFHYRAAMLHGYKHGVQNSEK